MSEESAWAQVDKLSDEVERLRRILRQDEVGPQEGDRVRLTYGDGSAVVGTWRAVLELDDGTLHTHTRGQVRRDVVPPSEVACSTCGGRGYRLAAAPGALMDRRGNVPTVRLRCPDCLGAGR